MKYSPAISSHVYLYFFSLLLLVLPAFFSQSCFAEDSPSRLIHEARQKNLSTRPEWLRLLHYRKRTFGGFKSEAAGASFFVATDGQTNPESELNATLSGLFSTEKRKVEILEPETVRCQFPARFAWLKSELSFTREELAKLDHEDCAEFEAFRKHLDAKSATLVFSSYHGANPSSAFGHSLLRLNKTLIAQDSEHQQLLDTGFNYAVHPTSSNPLYYAFAGFAGLFPGQFSALPYYYKVREYSDYEARDLWEYDLSLSSEEIDQLVRHAWELGSTHFNYYYLSENCSYHMLTLLEAAAPRLNLVSHIPFYVIPSDTLKALYFEPGLVRDVQYRPSLDTQFRARLKSLNDDEKAVLKRLIRSRDRAEVSRLSDPLRRAGVLDAYIDWIDLHFAEALMKREPEISRFKQTVLIERSRLPMAETLKIEPPPEARPDLSQGSARISVNEQQSQNYGNSTGVGIRFALHDLSEPIVGLPADSVIEFLNIDLRWWEHDRQLKLENFSLFGIGTYEPLESFKHNASWRFRVGAERVLDDRCENCTAAVGKFGYGATLLLAHWPRIETFLLLDGAADFSTAFNNSPLSLLLGPTIGLRVQLHRQIFWVTEGHYFRSLLAPSFEDRKLESILRFTSPSLAWSVDAHGVFSRYDSEIGLGIAHYF